MSADRPTTGPMLDDLLQPGLRIVFCGTAAGDRSARVGAYYAGPGNRFWKTLHEVGLTPHVIKPLDWRTAVEHGIGFTDVVKTQSGNDKHIDFRRSTPDHVRREIDRAQPRVLAFNGKKAAQVFLGRKTVEYGVQEDRVDATRLFVAPSTSGAANAYWDLEVWRALASLVERA